MFELGVRLAASPLGAYCLLDESPSDDVNSITLPTNVNTKSPPVAHLKTFLAPFYYDLDTPTFLPVCAAHSGYTNSVYRTAARHFQTTQDHYGDQVDTLLVAAAAVAQGHEDPLQAVDVRPLYAADNLVYGESVRYNAFEKLCGAWCYLADREEPHKLRPIDLLDWKSAEIFREFFRLGARLKIGLASRYGRKEERLRQRIAEAEVDAGSSGATEMAELLVVWRLVRNDPPWLVRTSAVSDADWDGFITDCETQVQQLTDLERILDQIASPVCQLPLQGLKADNDRLERALLQFKQRRPL